MTLESLRAVLGWCTLINLGLLTMWFLFFVAGRDWIYRLHSRWFKISEEHFDRVHYAGMAFYKIGIFLLNGIPWIALHLVD